jgi:hypothetical protein
MGDKDSRTSRHRIFTTNTEAASNRFGWSSGTKTVKGSVGSTVKVGASSLPGAIAGAKRKFGKGSDRTQRFDLNKNGLEIKVLCVVTEKESSTGADNTITPVV